MTATSPQEEFLNRWNDTKLKITFDVCQILETFRSDYTEYEYKI